MSWLSELFSSGSGEDPEAVRQRQAAAEAERTRQAQEFQQQLAQMQQQQQQSQQSQQQQQFEALMATLAPPPPPAIDPRIKQREDLRSGAMNSLNATFAPGFDNTYIPDTPD